MQKRLKIAFVTFGCRLNRAEALDLEARFISAGHIIIQINANLSVYSDKSNISPNSDHLSISPNPSLSANSDYSSISSNSDHLSISPNPGLSVESDNLDVSLVNGDFLPDIIIIRCCSITAKAEQDCNKTINRLGKIYPDAKILITGCHPEAQPLPPSLFNTGSDPTSPAGSDPMGTAGSDPMGTAGSDPMGTAGSDPMGVPKSTSRAYLKIQDGCSGKCTFCIVPHFRGLPVSVPFENVVARFRAFREAGYHEIVITGCNLSLYHNRGYNLAGILSVLAKEESVDKSPFRIRIGSIEPGIIDSQILNLFENHSNVCKFIHISLQSGSDPILKAMERPYEIAAVEKFVSEARHRLGGFITLGADVITGFPGETDEDFESTRLFLAKHNFTNVHVFPYSERPGTPAATMPGGIPVEIRRRRAKIISEEASARRRKFAESFIGREVEVCVERGGNHGWSSEYLPVKLKKTRERRSLVKVHVSSVDNFTLYE